MADPVLNISGPGSLAEGSGGSGFTPFNFTVTRTGSLTGTADASFFVWHETTSPNDIYANANGSIHFNPGQASQQLTIYVTADTTVEPDEAFHVQLYDPQGATLGTADARAVILNDDNAFGQPVSNFQFETTSVTAAEGNSGTKLFNYVVTRTGDVQTAADVFVSVTGSGSNPADSADARLIRDEVLSFSAGQTSKTYAVVVNGDTVVEPDETFTVWLTPTPHSFNTTGPNRSAQGVILNDDGSAPPPPPAGGGQVLTADDNPGQTLTGGAGNDTLNAGHNNDTLVGAGGGDAFVFKYLPWNAGHVSDFAVGSDRLDLSALLQASGYSGSDPVADGYVSLQPDGSGGTNIFYDTDGRASGNTIQFKITDLDHVSPTGLTWAQLTGSGGSSPPPPPPSGGQVLTANDSPGQVLTGGGGNDTLTAGHNSVVETGAGGADRFVFNVLPWNAGHITDFTPGTDHIDLSPLLADSHYSGSDPFADGYVHLEADGSGGTRIYYDTDGAAAGNTIQFLITTLDHVSPAQLGTGDFILH